MTPTPSEALRALRSGVLDQPELVGAPLRHALGQACQAWLVEQVPPDAGVALAAVGAFGRDELTPGSDLDLVLLHRGSEGDGVASLADRLWYPIWDAGVGLDHAVRTVEGALSVAREDVKAQLGLLDARHLAGEAALTAELRTRALSAWCGCALARLPELNADANVRWQRAGDAAFLLEPHLKDSRGGLRDAHLLRAFALAQFVDLPTAARAANAELLDIRGELHRVTSARGGGADVLRHQDADAVASALGVLDASGRPDRDEVLLRVHRAARTIGHALDTAWRRLEVDRPRSGVLARMRGTGRAGPGPRRDPLAPDVVAQDGEVMLARDAVPERDAGLVLRVARAAAQHGLPIGAFALQRLTQCPPLPEPWPRVAREDLIGLLSAGPAAVPVAESLDLAGLWVGLIPEWSAVQFRAQHNPVHRYTVDRHLLETAAHAAALTREVARPDLLLVAALLHDIGKGYPGDHSAVGAERAKTITTRMGFGDQDSSLVAMLVRHHLLMADTSQRRDLDDPRTVATVVEALDGSAVALDLLAALTAADAIATGPGAVSEWKSALIADLVARVHGALGGQPVPARCPITAGDGGWTAPAGELSVHIGADRVLIAAPDAVGVLYRTAGVLALHGVDVRAATITSRDGTAVNSFVVTWRFGRPPDAGLLRTDLARALDGRSDLAERLRDKERTYRREDRPGLPPVSTAPPLVPPVPTVHWFDGEATDATVLEVRAEDAIGLLCRIAAALERSGLDVRAARVASFGGSVVDSFYVTTRDGGLVPVGLRREVEIELRSV